MVVVVGGKKIGIVGYLTPETEVINYNVFDLLKKNKWCSTNWFLDFVQSGKFSFQWRGGVNQSWSFKAKKLNYFVQIIWSYGD